jgi:hypothetical protein
MWGFELFKQFNKFMIILTGTTDKIQVVLTNTVTANQLSCFASYRDTTSTTITPSRNVLLTNNTSAVDLVDSPGASTQRVVDYLSVFNRDNSVAEITINFVDNLTSYRLFVVRLAPNEKLEYQEGYGFKVISNGYSVKQTTSIDTPSLNSNLSMFVLKNDINLTPTNANTRLDVPSLTFPVIANKKYYFRFFIFYTSNATTTGSRFNIYGPSSTSLINYQTFNTLTLTTITSLLGQNDYLYTTASNASSANINGNTVTIEGYINPDVDGFVIPSFACGVASPGSITVKSRSFIQYQQIA